MSNKYGPRIVTDGLVLCLDAADRNSYPGSGTSWGDLSGNGNNAALTNGPVFSSGNGGSIVFDGVNDYADGTINSLSNWTIALWYLSKEIDAKAVYYPFGIGGSNGLGFTGTYTSGTQGRWYFWDNTSVISSINTSVISNKWYYLCVSKNNSTYNLYTNGYLSLSETGTNRSLTSYSLGRRTDSLWYVNGLISVAKIYNRVLSADEVRRNYNALKGRFGL